eukprot:SAG11_NODE_307_length_10982_cov_22.068823_6_plen_175_part_00
MLSCTCACARARACLRVRMCTYFCSHSASRSPRTHRYDALVAVCTPLRLWLSDGRYPVKPIKLYNPVTSLLLGDAEEWTGMKTVRELRREKEIGAMYLAHLRPLSVRLTCDDGCSALPAVPHNPDSTYKPIERKPKVFNPLKIPKSLQVSSNVFCRGCVHETDPLNVCEASSET